MTFAKCAYHNVAHVFSQLPTDSTTLCLVQNAEIVKRRILYCTHSGIFYDAIGVKKVSNEEMSFVQLCCSYIVALMDSRRIITQNAGNEGLINHYSTCLKSFSNQKYNFINFPFHM